MWRAVLFAGLLTVAATEPARADQSEALLSACPALRGVISPGSNAPNAAEISRVILERRYELGAHCLMRAMPLVFISSGGEADQDAFDFYAFLLVRTAHEARLCSPAAPGELDLGAWMARSMLEIARTGLNLREQSNRLRYADALRSALQDPRSVAYAPASCASGAAPARADEAHIAALNDLVGAIVQALPHEASVGLFTVWADLPMLDAQVGLESRVSGDLPGVDVERGWVFRHNGETRALMETEGSGRDAFVRTGIYVTPDRQIGFISGRYSWILGLDGRRPPAANQDSWRYIGAFEMQDVRWSGSGRRRTPRFVVASESPECIVALEETDFREPARAASCEPAPTDSVEYVYSAALHLLFDEWWNRAMQRMTNPGSRGAIVGLERRQPPRQQGVANSAEFLFAAHTRPDEENLLLVVKVIDTEVETDLRLSALRFAAAGADEYWAIDPRTRRTTMFSALRDGRYTRRRNARASEMLEASSVTPELRLRLDQLDLATAAETEFVAAR